jgi:hypothetical protein
LLVSSAAWLEPAIVPFTIFESGKGFSERKASLQGRVNNCLL